MSHFKFLTTLIFFISVFYTIPKVDAQIYFPIQAEIYQGNTLEIKIPNDDIDSVSGNLDGKEIKFFEIEEELKENSPLTRGEFLDLLFQNYNVSISNENDNSNIQHKIFSDINKESYYFEITRKAFLLNVIHGFEDNTFRPFMPITRAEISKILVNTFHPSPKITFDNTFQDIPQNHTFFKFINKAYKAKIFKGYDDGNFRPNQAITFFESKMVLDRLLGMKNETLRTRKYLRGFAGIHRTKDLGEKILTISYQKTDHEIETQTLSIQVSSNKTDLFGKDYQEKTWNMIYSALKNTNEKQLWENSFIVPTTGEITLGFGDILYINNKYSGSHFGIDYGNKEGTEINASNNGIIVLSDYTPSYGNTIIIDHGHNIFTLYMHLSDLKKEVGTFVQKGELIGLMGSTGIATGSHLHFTQFVGDVIVNNWEWFDGKF